MCIILLDLHRRRSDVWQDNNEEVRDCLIAALYRESVRNGSLADDEDDIKGVGASVYSGNVLVFTAVSPLFTYSSKAGVDTVNTHPGFPSVLTYFQTSIVLSTFMLAMVLHPRVYVKARDEIERIVGMSNLPTLEHKDSLPYINCIIQELYRYVAVFRSSIVYYTLQDTSWNPPLPLGRVTARWE